MVPSNSVFSAFAFIGFVLVTIPLPCHLQSWNTGTCMYIAWTSLGCLTQFINSIIWNDNVVNWAPVWCDITARFIIGFTVGIPASSLCMIRRLYRIATMQSLNRTRDERRRAVVIDLSIGVGFPCVIMALEYIVQGHRFDIFEQIGCFPFTLNTPPAYPLVLMWPVVIGLISAIYAVLTFRAAWWGKARLEELLRTNCHISASHYWRLMAVCGVEILCTVPIGLYPIIMDATQHVSPWTGWSDVHSNFSSVEQISTDVWQKELSNVVGLEMMRWLYVFCAFVFFAFFGLAEEVRMGYCRAFRSFARSLGYLSDTSHTNTSAYG
ncbi:pheromone receptor [Leucogyrophana mollusca]|uniref:Pheromone receptor n=1 Tax=Leucogyrophana mollusca TaxID=85980 RepID=A0ACB8BDQ6_9AGAM|nr:pheromone receptor [Leucogyrophana mollusca]